MLLVCSLCLCASCQKTVSFWNRTGNLQTLSLIWTMVTSKFLKNTDHPKTLKKVQKIQIQMSSFQYFVDTVFGKIPTRKSSHQLIAIRKSLIYFIG